MSPHADAARLRGNAAFARAEWDAAIGEYSAALTDVPADARLHSNRSAAYLAKQREACGAPGAPAQAGRLLHLAQLAAADALAATTLRPAWPDGWYRLYAAHAAAGAVDKGVAALKEGLARCPNAPALVTALHSHSLPNAASDSARLLANDAFRAGNWEEAVAGYTRSVALAKQAGVKPDRRAFSNRSAAWLRMAIDTDRPEAFAKAVEDADRCIAIDRQWPKAWFRKGTALLEDGRPARARDVFLSGLVFCPDSEVLLESLAHADKVIMEEGAETDPEEGESGGSGGAGGGGAGGGGARKERGRDARKPAPPAPVAPVVAMRNLTAPREDPPNNSDSSSQSFASSSSTPLASPGRTKPVVSASPPPVPRPVTLTKSARVLGGDDAMRSLRSKSGRSIGSPQAARSNSKPSPVASPYGRLADVPDDLVLNSGGRTGHSTVERHGVPLAAAADHRQIVSGVSGFSLRGEAPQDTRADQLPAAGDPVAGHPVAGHSGAVHVGGQGLREGGDPQMKYASRDPGLCGRDVDAAAEIAAERAPMALPVEPVAGKRTSSDNRHSRMPAHSDSPMHPDSVPGGSRAFSRAASHLQEDLGGMSARVEQERVRTTPPTRPAAQTAPKKGGKKGLRKSALLKKNVALPKKAQAPLPKKTAVAPKASPSAETPHVTSTTTSHATAGRAVPVGLNLHSVPSSEDEYVHLGEEPVLSSASVSRAYTDSATEGHSSGSSLHLGGSPPSSTSRPGQGVSERPSSCSSTSSGRIPANAKPAAQRRSPEMKPSKSTKSFVESAKPVRSKSKKGPRFGSSGKTGPKVESQAGPSGAGSSDAPRAASEVSAERKPTLYEILNVPSDATDGAIRRAYYVAARELHPDKNPGDETATQRFQEVSDAYQVLSNKESREKYDRHGDKGLDKGGIDAVDPQTLFAIVFGSDQFVDYVGELKLASLASNVDEDGNAPDEDTLRFLQEERVRKLVDGLKSMLRPWVAGDTDEFVRWAESEMKRLADTNFGEQLLSTIGNVYVHRVEIIRGRKQVLGLNGLLKDASYRRQKIAAQMRANAATRTVMHRQKRLHDRVTRLNREGETISEREAEEVAVEMARNAVDMMWKISVLDIRDVLEAVVAGVLSGDDISAAELDGHAAGPESGEWGDAASSASDGPGGVRRGAKRKAAPDARAEIIAARAAGVKTLGKMMLAAARHKRASEGSTAGTRSHT